VNHQIFERKLRSRDSPVSTPLWVSVPNKLLLVMDFKLQNAVGILSVLSVYTLWIALSGIDPSPELPQQCVRVYVRAGTKLLSLRWIHFVLCLVTLASGTRDLDRLENSWQFIVDIVLWIRSQMKWDYPLNLSILLRGGKETNKDSPSNGEWSGKSSIWKAIQLNRLSHCILETFCQCQPRYKSFETGYHRGWESRLWPGVRHVRRAFVESCCLGVQH
jgi:hypothetical protein